MKLVDSYRTDSLTVANGAAKSDALQVEFPNPSASDLLRQNR